MRFVRECDRVHEHWRPRYRQEEQICQLIRKLQRQSDYVSAQRLRNAMKRRCAVKRVKKPKRLNGPRMTARIPISLA